MTLEGEYYRFIKDRSMRTKFVKLVLIRLGAIERKGKVNLLVS